MTVKTIEAGGPDATQQLVLTDDRVAVSVLPLHLPVDDLFDYLSKAGWIEIVNQVTSRYSANCLRHTITIAIVNNGYRAAIGCLDSVLEIVSEG